LARSKPDPRSCLVVEDDERLRSSLVDALGALRFRVVAAASVAEARERLEAATFDLVVLDVALPDGRAVDVLEIVARSVPAPQVVAMSGAAGPDESFELATLGVRAFLKKPLVLTELEAAVRRALSEPPDLVPHLRSSVGLKPIRSVEESVRATMVDEALARGGGSRRSAAKLLGISRQLLQHILRRG
jgi:DNA-binding NtrC family response regulator